MLCHKGFLTDVGRAASYRCQNVPSPRRISVSLIDTGSLRSHSKRVPNESERVCADQDRSYRGAGCIRP